MARGERSVLATVHGLEHVQGLARAALPDDDPVGPHVHRVPEQVADRDLALALEVRRASLERDDVFLPELQLCSVLDRHDALVVRDERESTFSVVVLPEPVPPDTKRLSRTSMHAFRKSNISGVAVPNRTRSSTVYGRRELPDGDDRADQRQRLDDRVDAAAVR